MQLNNLKISKETLITLSKKEVIKKEAPISDADGIQSIIDMHNLFANIFTTMTDIETIMVLQPHVKTEPDVVALLLGVESLGVNTLAVTLERGFLLLRNFFLRLKDAVFSFFKYLFDKNSRLRRNLSSEMMKFNKRSTTYEPTNSPVVSLIPNAGFVSTVGILERLYEQAEAVSKSEKKESILENSLALQAFGYEIVEYRVVNVNAVAEFPKKDKPLESKEVDWGWSLATLIKSSNAVLKLSSKAEKLNYIKDKLDNSIKAATRSIDALNVIGNSEKAIKLQTELNEAALICGFLFNCSVVFQNKVDFLAKQLTECWFTLNNVGANS